MKNLPKATTNDKITSAVARRIVLPQNVTPILMISIDTNKGVSKGSG